MAISESGAVGRSAPPPRRPNRELRGREWLTKEEVDRLVRCAEGSSRYGTRDALLIEMSFRHGLRVGESVRLQWSQVDLVRRTVYVDRLKGSKNGTHELTRGELRRLRELQRRDGGRSRFVFRNERGGPLSTSAVRKLLARIGARCEPPIPIHPHMLRHACGYALINAGHSTRVVQEHLGHRQIRHTERYTELCPDRSARLWGD